MSSNVNERTVQLSDMNLTKEEQRELLLSILPACQPQEGSPANTFTSAEIDELQKALPNMQIGAKKSFDDFPAKTQQINISDLDQWQAPSQQDDSLGFSAPPQDGSLFIDAPPQDGSDESIQHQPKLNEVLDWHGAPRFVSQVDLPRAFRSEVRAGRFTSPTNAVCPGFLQCNLVVLPQGPIAFDFLLFCQRNPKACPLIEVCDVGSPFPTAVAPDADLRTDVPK